MSDPILKRIHEALRASAEIFADYEPGKVEAEKKAGGDPVTAADNAVDELLRQLLPRDGEGWLSEETTDDLRRLEASRVWVVDPLDGTKEFVNRNGEFTVNIALIDNHRPMFGVVHVPVHKKTDFLNICASVR